MPGPLACLLSFGLTCSPEAETMEVPPPTPVDPADPETPDEPAKGEASQLLAKVQAFYDSTNDLEASFKQTYTHAVYKTKKVSKGVLRVRKPGYMVWDYAVEEDPDFWVDGDRLWVVEHPQRQVLKQDVAGSDIAGADKFLFGGKQLTDDFLVKVAGEALEKQYGMVGHTAIRLKPKRKNSHYKELLLIVDEGTGRVDAFVVLNADDSTNRFELTGTKRNQGLPESKFKFQKPKGYSEIAG